MKLEFEKTKSADRHKQAYEAVVNNPEFQKWFEGSKIVDENGKPQVFYHSTVFDFNQFDPDRGEMGSHFGSLAAAEERVIRKSMNEVEKQKFIPVLLKVSNPIFIDRDINNWEDITDFLTLLFSHSSLSDVQKDRIHENFYSGNVKGGLKNLHKRLLDLGYDGIVYKNLGETNGEPSVIVFGKNQAWSLYANKSM